MAANGVDFEKLYDHAYPFDDAFDQGVRMYLTDQNYDRLWPNSNRTSLSRRLRNQALSDPHDEREPVHASLLREAADYIDKLESLNATLRKENGKAS